MRPGVLGKADVSPAQLAVKQRTSSQSVYTGPVGLKVVSVEQR